MTGTRIKPNGTDSSVTVVEVMTSTKCSGSRALSSRDFQIASARWSEQ